MGHASQAPKRPTEPDTLYLVLLNCSRDQQQQPARAVAFVHISSASNRWRTPSIERALAPPRPSNNSSSSYATTTFHSSTPVSTSPSVSATSDPSTAAAAFIIVVVIVIVIVPLLPRFLLAGPADLHRAADRRASQGDVAATAVGGAEWRLRVRHRGR